MYEQIFDLRLISKETIKIIGAELDLIYQYDDLFGMIVEYPDNITLEKTITFIKKYI